MKKLLLLDNYDSFTHNLLHLLQMVRPDYKIVIMRNRDKNIYREKWDGIIVSPGPGTPEETGLLNDFFETVIIKEEIPYLGICLGMQFLAYFYGVTVDRTQPYHGRTVNIEHDNKALFSDLPNPYKVMRYNSLGVKKDDLMGSPLEVLALEEDKNDVMALKHRTLPFLGVQFHPESFLTEQADRLINNFFEAYLD
ncbi:MAG: aminodeoxychorismate/anthranilate synthase component II [Spirochaetales bacterium]|nr:aminodeoxychorismate/anthranilate synthase component II [Spirochaetales bacterium]